MTIQIYSGDINFQVLFVGCSFRLWFWLSHTLLFISVSSFLICSVGSFLLVCLWVFSAFAMCFLWSGLTLEHLNSSLVTNSQNSWNVFVAQQIAIRESVLNESDLTVKRLDVWVDLYWNATCLPGYIMHIVDKMHYCRQNALYKLSFMLICISWLILCACSCVCVYVCVCVRVCVRGGEMVIVRLCENAQTDL